LLEERRRVAVFEPDAHRTRHTLEQRVLEDLGNEAGLPRENSTESAMCCQHLFMESPLQVSEPRIARECGSQRVSELGELRPL
jgi:hypothetical protein